MTGFASIFLDFNLPNPTTWFYFSFLLAVALFFKFSRFLSVRNWDVVTIFLLVPGLLLLQESRTGSAVAVARAVGESTQALPVAGTGLAGVRAVTAAADPDLGPTRLLRFGYLWLLVGSVYFLVRCLVDLTLERRPALSPNLTFGGLGWLSGALFICLVAVAVRHPPETRPTTVGKTGVPLAIAKKQGENLVQTEVPPGLISDQECRFWVERGLAMICHLAVVAGLVMIGARHFQDAPAGMAAATFYLLLPYTSVHIGQWHHVWPMALVVWALALYRRPTVAGLLLGLAAGTMYFPALVFPLWCSFYWRRGAGRFAAAFALSAAACLAVAAVVLSFQGELQNTIERGLSLSDWQPWKAPTTEGFWMGIHWAYRIPVFIAYLAFLVATALWPAPKNLAHVLALSAAVLIGMQFWYADQGGVYVLWYLPLILLLVFRPNLSDRRPLVIQPETDWLTRFGRVLGRGFARLLRLPQPLSRVR
jgi:hypothetical protein